MKWLDRIIAKRGDRVTRENGEYICRVTRDIHGGDVPRLDAFEDWQIPVPLTSSPLPTRDKEGERWMRKREQYATDLHLENGWSNEVYPLDRAASYDVRGE